MFPFFRGKEKEKLTLIFDIQSSVVRGALVQDLQKGMPSIIHSCIVHVPFRPNSGSSYLVKRTMKAVHDVLDDTYRFIHTLDRHTYHKKIDAVHFVLSSPWIVSQAKVITIHKENDTVVTEKLIRGLVEDERKTLHIDPKLLSIVEEKVFDVRLNGYSISEWMEKDATQIEVSYTSSYATKNVVEKFTDALNHRVSSRNVHFHSSLLLQYIGIQHIYDQTHNYCIVYLHGELTDMVFVHRGFPVFFGSFPFGVQTLIRKIAKNANVDVGTAESMLSLYIGEHTETAHFSANRKIIEEVTMGWKEQVHNILKQNVAYAESTHDIIVSSRTHEDYFLSCLRQLCPTARIQSLSSELVQSKVAFSNTGGEHIRLLALYASALSNIGTINK